MVDPPIIRFVLLGALSLPHVVRAGVSVEFVEVGAARGIGDYQMAPGMGGGVAAADYDDDGDIDLFVPTAKGVPDQLYRNRGDGTFEEIAAQVRLASTASHRVALWLDYDGDGALDLLVAGDCWDDDSMGSNSPPACDEAVAPTLYRQNGDGSFTDVSVGAGIAALNIGTTGTHQAGLAAGDLNQDGFLDLLICRWEGGVTLLENTGRGKFIDITASSGLGAGGRQAWQAIMHDFDRDGWLDIFVAVDHSANHLWMNRKDGTFVDMAKPASVDNAWTDMGIAVGDYDNDGDLDLYVTNISEVRDGVARHNVLYRNDSSGGAVRFTEVAVSAGVDQGCWGWGATFLDADGDGWVDLATTNGIDTSLSGWFPDPSRFFVNLGGATPSFEDVSSAVGFDDTFVGNALVALDYDRDGDLDLLQACNAGGPLRLLENRRPEQTRGRNYLVVKPRMDGPNGRAIGAVIGATAGGRTITRLVTAGTSFMGQEPAEAVFGLADADIVDTVTVEWPDGDRTVHERIRVNQVVTITKRGADTAILVATAEATRDATGGPGLCGAGALSVICLGPVWIGVNLAARCRRRRD